MRSLVDPSVVADAAAAAVSDVDDVMQQAVGDDEEVRTKPYILGR